MQTYLTVSARRTGSAAVIELAGELDVGSASDLENALERACRDQPDLVVIDLAEMRFIDAAGLRTLVGARLAAGRKDRRLVLTHVRRPVERVLELAQLTDLFTIREQPPY